MSNHLYNEYWAHTSAAPSCEAAQPLLGKPLSEHLEAVAQIAEQLASLALPGADGFVQEARLAGLFHDLGKYTPAFQRRIRGLNIKCPHAIHGAMQLAGETNAPLFALAALTIAGHHAGLPDFAGGEHSFKQKLKDADRQRELALLLLQADADSKTLHHALSWLETKPAPERLASDAWDLHTRMLFSCLVDADHLHSAERVPIQAPLEAEQRLSKLLDHINNLRNEHPKTSLSALRQQILNDCLSAASRSQSLFSLSVPTGGGKTLAAMAFALKRAALFPERFRRVVVVIPYLSIIEQNASIYSTIFGSEAVLEHHSGSIMPLRAQPAADAFSDPYFVADKDEDDEQTQNTFLRPETENWDAPIVVTTSTRFFESLFSNRPKDLRRVHNLARSIVILDEVQTLPRRLLAPLLKMQKELAERWGVNFVFSTATQPAFEAPPQRRSSVFWPSGTVCEIIREPAPLRAALRRTTLDWRLDVTMNWRQVAEQLLEKPQALAVVNLRDHALELYQELLDSPGAAEGLFHLSTRMSAAHRLRTIQIIRDRLLLQLPCRVVSTQLIEAGVDLDFPFVMRALAPLDAIVQAAGRADREGKLTAKLGCPAGEVVVFRPEDERTPPHEYKEATDITRALAAGCDIQVDDAEAMRKFYERYYDESDKSAMSAKMNDMRSRLEFATLAAEFEYINSRARDVFVPDDEEAKAAIASLDALKQLTPALRRTLQRHTVGLSPKEFEQARDAGVIREVVSASQLWIAASQAYDEQLGLQFTLSAEALVLS
ncbi:MAG: CRISPR-associated helicase Cas3' [Terracidiphilus sp.]|nr:CRISPR-associated helicase Cas3' [Terracidiphilus sp.]